MPGALMLGLVFALFIVLLMVPVVKAFEVWLEADLVQVLWMGFGFQILGVLTNQAIVTYIYRYSDSKRFFDDGGRVWRTVLSDPTYYTSDYVLLLLDMERSMFMAPEGTGPMIGLAAPLAGLTGSFFAMSIFWGLVAFLGKVCLFVAMKDWLPKAQHGLIMACILMQPTMAYWTGGLIKEGVVITCIGFIAFGLYRFKQAPYLTVLLVPGSVFFLSNIKPHFLLTAAVAAAAWWYWMDASRRGPVELKPFRLIGVTIAAYVMLVAIGWVIPEFALENIIDEGATVQVKGARGGSEYSLGAGEGLIGTIPILPLALLTGLFRPTLLDANNGQTLLNALESTAIMVVSFQAFGNLRRIGWLEPFRRYPILVFCFVFGVGTMTALALASGNLGSLSRYRSPAMPFFICYLAVAWSLRAQPATVARVAPVGALPGSR